MKVQKLPEVFNHKDGQLAFADFHAHVYQDFAKPDPVYTTDRFKAQVDALKLMYDKARELNYMVTFAGDLFHKRSLLDTRVFTHIFSVIAQYEDVPTLLVRGNHDSVTNSLDTVSTLDPFSELPNCYVVTKPEVLQSDLGTFVCLPYGEEIDTMKEFLVKASKVKGTTKYLIAHIGVDGSQTGRYSHSLGGEFSVGDLQPDAYKAVILGHYHNRQTLGGLAHVHYVGSAIATTFNDEGMEKGYSLIDKKGNISFEAIPQKQFITVDVNHVPEDEVLKNNYIRFQGTPEELSVVAELKEANQLDNIRLVVQKSYEVDTRIDIDASSSPHTVVKKYTEEECPYLTDKALECLQEALAIE
jgi:DNA repair exonuclease SbcCD nuclease subunit